MGPQQFSQLNCCPATDNPSLTSCIFFLFVIWWNTEKKNMYLLKGGHLCDI